MVAVLPAPQPTAPDIFVLVGFVAGLVYLLEFATRSLIRPLWSRWRHRQPSMGRAFRRWRIGAAAVTVAAGITALFVDDLAARVPLATLMAVAFVVGTIAEVKATKSAPVHSPEDHTALMGRGKPHAPDESTSQTVQKLQLLSSVPIREATPEDFRADAEVEWLRKHEATSCLDPVSGERSTTSFESLCLLWEETLATWATYHELEVLPRNVYPHIPSVHSGLFTKTETDACRRRFVAGALKRLVLRGLVEEQTRHGSETFRPDIAFGDDRYGEITEDTSYSVYRWTSLGRATINRVMKATP